MQVRNDRSKSRKRFVFHQLLSWYFLASFGNPKVRHGLGQQSTFNRRFACWAQAAQRQQMTGQQKLVIVFSVPEAKSAARVLMLHHRLSDGGRCSFDFFFSFFPEEEVGSSCGETTETSTCCEIPPPLSSPLCHKPTSHPEHCWPGRSMCLSERVDASEAVPGWSRRLGYVAYCVSS